jgi:hypothetical protein
MKFFTAIIIALLCLSFSDCKKKETQNQTVTDVQMLSGITYTGHTCIGYTLCFSAVATGAKSYAWDMGDGSQSTEAHPCHEYADTGLFTVKLTINNIPSLTKDLQIYVSKVPLYTYLLSGVKTWRHTTGTAYSSGWDTTRPAPSASFEITYIDPVTVSIGLDTFLFARTVPQYDSILYYGKYFPNGSGYYTSKTIRLHHSAAGDSIHYSIWNQHSAGGASTEDFFAP